MLGQCQGQLTNLARNFARLNAVWNAAPDILTTDLQDELILMDAAGGVMFSLNATGRLLWHSLPASTEALVQRLVEQYDLAPQDALSDVQYLLGELEQRGLIRPV